METILNLLWLIVALLIIGFWRLRWSASKRKSRTLFISELIAVTCIIALLFPAISLTDDLHPEIVAMDAASGKRSSYLVLAGATHTRTAAERFDVHFATGLLPPLPVTPIGLIALQMVLPAETCYSALPPTVCSGRSPPSLL